MQYSSFVSAARQHSHDSCHFSCHFSMPEKQGETGFFFWIPPLFLTIKGQKKGRAQGSRDYIGKSGGGVQNLADGVKIEKGTNWGETGKETNQLG